MSIGILAILMLIFMWWMQKPSHLPLPPTANVIQREERKTVHPVLTSDASTSILIGRVLSHETANIYPRRDGIVEDVYVDIGDSVQKNQVVALLLPKGVEGQSAALIAEKNARKAQAESDLKTAKIVAEESIRHAKQSIKEKETDLEIAKREQKSLIEKFKEHEENVAQMYEQAFITIQNTRQLLEFTLLGSNARTDLGVRESDLIHSLGKLDGSDEKRYKSVANLNALSNAEKRYFIKDIEERSKNIADLFTYASTAIRSTIDLLQATPSSPFSNNTGTFSHDELSTLIAKTLSAKDMLLKAEERIEDTKNALRTLTSSEANLYGAYLRGTEDAAQSNTVSAIEEDIQSAHNALTLVEANQEQLIDTKESAIDIANAMLYAETAKSGHRKILSPFTGIISKRFIDVGTIVMSSMPAFELTDVPTSLAKKAKREIQFGLPESLQSALKIGDTVSFFIPHKEEETFTATVTRKSPQVDIKTHTVTIQAKIADDIKLPHNTSVRIQITDQSNPIFSVPSFAVKREDGKNIIWIIDPESMEPIRRTITVQSEDGEFAHISGHISQETKIILNPPDMIQ
jgi:multidrug efflux pump subunit AcrA (membrane-fusion protein)